MGRKAGRNDVREQHAQLLTGIAIWLEQQPDTTPLELGVFNEVAARVRERSKAGAIVRVRIKNLGERTGRTDHPYTGESNLWSLDEMERLRQMNRERMSTLKIAETLGRSPGSVRAQKQRLGLRFPSPPPKIPKPPTPPKAEGSGRYKRPEVLAAARRLRERRLAELSYGAAD